MNLSVVYAYAYVKDTTIMRCCVYGIATLSLSIPVLYTRVHMPLQIDGIRL